VDGQVDRPGEQRPLQLLGEQAVAADLRERLVGDAVALGLEDYQLDRAGVGDGAEPVGDMIGLPEGERAAAGAQADRGRGHACVRK
jgi:hypothetical protein